MDAKITNSILRAEINNWLNESLINAVIEHSYTAPVGLSKEKVIDSYVNIVSDLFSLNSEA